MSAVAQLEKQSSVILALWHFMSQLLHFQPRVEKQQSVWDLPYIHVRDPDDDPRS